MTPLAKEQAISQEELDNAVQANLGAVAQVEFLLKRASQVADRLETVLNPSRGVNP